MPRAWIAALATGVLAVAVLVLVATTTTTTRAFTIGVLSTTPSPPIAAGRTACQRPISVPPGGAFDAVDFEVGNYHRKSGPALDVTVRSLDGSFPVRHGVLPAGYPDVAFQQRHVVPVGPVPAGAVVAVCFRNRGPGPVALFGGGDAAARESSAYVDEAPVGFDYDLVFRTGARSFATLLPEIASRASLFRPPWLEPGVFYGLLVLVLLGLPLLLAAAVRRLDR